MVPDPGRESSADPSNPQSWNLYAYVLNNPIRFVDKFGFYPCPVTVKGANGGESQIGDCEDQSNGCMAVSYGTATTVNCPAPAPVGTSGSGLDSFLAGLEQGVQDAIKATGDFIKAPRDQGCMKHAVASGAAIGGTVGTGLGAFGGGTIGGLATAGGGPIIVIGIGGGGALGAVKGGIIGASAGATVGAAMGSIACRTGSGGGGGGGGGDNQRQNKQASDAKRAAEQKAGKKFTEAQDRRFHDEITGQEYDYHTLVEIAVGILEGHI
jgi:hypothetical protein